MKIVSTLLHAVLAFACWAVMMGTPDTASASLLAAPSLERNILSITQRYEHLDDEYNVFESQVETAVDERGIEGLEIQYNEIAFLLRVSLGQPLIFRQLYNELFSLNQHVGERLALVKAIIGSARNNQEMVKEALREYRRMPLDRLSQNTRDATQGLERKLCSLNDRMVIWIERLNPVAERLETLFAMIETDLRQLQESIPDWLVYYMFNTDYHLMQSRPWEIMPVSWSAWVGGLFYSLAAKLPDNQERLNQSLIRLGLWTAGVLMLGIPLWRRRILRLLPEQAAARRNLALGCSGLVLALLITISTLNLQFPGRMLFQTLVTLFMAFGGYRLSWGLRGLAVPITAGSPLGPLFWLFCLGLILEFLSIPQVLVPAVWPLAMLAGAWACLRNARRTELRLERSICKVSIWFYLGLAGLCVAGLAILALSLGLAWFVANVLLQTGVALSQLVRERLVGRYADAGRFGLSVIAGLAMPVVWILLALGFALWGVSQLGEIGLLARFVNLDKASDILVILLMVLCLDRVLASLLTFYNTYPASRKRPIKGYIQIAKLFVYIIGSVVLICLILEKSPWGILGGLGAMAAVLMFVFKNTIQSLMASIQIVADDLVRIGDWIEVEGKDMNGDVIDVTLHSVKVQNFDKTISTMPTYALISSSFKNWRGMYESKGRRIKRRLLLDQASIRFLDAPALASLSQIELLESYFQAEPAPAPPADPVQAMCDRSVLNHPQLTNAGAYRAYMVAWLHAHPLIHDEMTFLVRLLEPTIDGLPLEIYVFVADTNWPTFESILADVFEHAEAALPLFDLRVTQRPAPSHAPMPTLAEE